MVSAEPPVFHEEQRFLARPLALALLVLGVLGVAYGLATGSWHGPEALPYVLLLLLPTLFYLLELRVAVYLDRVEIRFRPLLRREIPLSTVESCQAVEYRPIREYGGWGIRMRPGKRAYTVSGTEAAELALDDGRRILIGSQRSRELAAAIRGGLAERPSAGDLRQ
jgi:hypothetical protein